MARAPSNRTCLHCRGPLSADAGVYCCGGCDAAHELLTSLGLERYYDLAQNAAPGTPPSGETPLMPWLPGLIAAARALSPSPDEVTLELDVQGLHCAACVWVIRALYDRCEGGKAFALNPGLGRITVTFDLARFPLEHWLAELAKVGYRTGPPTRSAQAPSDGLGLRLGMTVAIAMNAMGMSLAGYLGLQPGDDAGLYTLFGWANLGLSTLAMLIAAPVFIRGAWHALRRGTLHLDVPIALGVVLAFVGSVTLFFDGHPELAYFDTLDTFLALMLLGRWAQRRFLDNNRRLLLEDDGFGFARIKRVAPDGRLTSCPLGELAQGTRFLVAPGELVPVAADPEADEVEVDLAWITGESEPVTIHRDHVRAVPAGAHLVGKSAAILVAREPFSASALHTLLARTRSDDAQPTSGFWHHLTIAWVLTVLAFAAITALVWAGDGASSALRHATAVLVVTCPCAIGLASPLAYELAHLALKKRGLLLRRAGVLDRATALRHVVFDKTGTLTLTALEVANPQSLLSLAEAERERLWQMTARSNHPRSRAIQVALGVGSGRLDDSAYIVESAGRGLEGIFPDGLRELVSDDKSLVFENGTTVLARIAFRESLRPDARAEVAALVAAGVDVHIASGDVDDKVEAVAETLGIPTNHAHGHLRPDDKAALVERLGASETLFIGDGINDAPAFDVAGIAGTPAIDRPTLPARADFVVLGQGIGPLAELVTLARRTRRITRRNLVIAGAYNVLGLTAGVMGWLTPVVAAVAMPLSSLLVIALTLFSARAPAPPRAPARALAPAPMVP